MRTRGRDTVAAPTDVVTRLRRASLERQGLLRRATFGSGLAGTRRAIERLGYVQIDTISVISRAHDHVLQTRVPGYRPAMLERLQAEGSIFEYWAHAAAYLPMRDYRFALPRMADMRARRERWVRSRDGRLMQDVLERVRQEGPLKTRDFEAPSRRGTGWWDWKPAKQALEQLFMQGDLMVCGRDGFQKIYDLRERVLPSWVDTREPSLGEYARHLLQSQLTAHGFASVQACCYQRRTPGLRQAVIDALDSAAANGELVRLALGAPEREVFADPGVLQGRAPPARASARLLSPFDNAIILRHRGVSLFGFDYQLECYVPEPRRRFGYFCLPLLYRDRFVGRADCKAHRPGSELEIKRLFIEHERALRREPETACNAVAQALTVLAAHNGCARVRLSDVVPAHWREPLSHAVDGRLQSHGSTFNEETSP